MIFVLPGLSLVTSKEEAKQLAIDWQQEAGKQDISYFELTMFQSYFEQLAKRFNLTEEFKENGII